MINLFNIRVEVAAFGFDPLSKQFHFGHLFGTQILHIGYRIFHMTKPNDNLMELSVYEEESKDWKETDRSENKIRICGRSLRA